MQDKKTSAILQQKAKQTFNEAWKYLEKKKLTKKEKISLLNLVHTSFYLWQQVPANTSTHTSISLWQISKAYAHIGDGANALLFAEENIQLCKTEKPDGFYTAYAYESAARAHIVSGNKTKAAVQIKHALKAIQTTKEKELQHFFKDIEALKKLSVI
jgi:ATP/maltotriose-dependent transcriptional regulator MalT